MPRRSVAHHVRQGLAHDLQHVHLLVRAELAGAELHRERHLQPAAGAVFARGVLHQGGEVGRQAEAEGHQQLAQLAVGGADALAQVGQDRLRLGRARRVGERALQQADLDLHVGQRLGERVVQLARDHRALLLEREQALLLRTPRRAERHAHVARQGLDELALPVLQARAVGQRKAQHAVMVLAVAQRKAQQGRRQQRQRLPLRARPAGGAGILATLGSVRTRSHGRSDDRRRGPGARLDADEGTLQSGDAVDVAQGRIVGIGRARRLVEAGNGVVEQLQRAVAALQLGGLLGDALLEQMVVAGELVGHQVEGAADLAELVLAGVTHAHAEVAAGDAARGVEQAAERAQQRALQEHDHHQHHPQRDRGGEREDAAQLVDAALVLLPEHRDQAIDLADEVVHPCEQRLDLACVGRPMPVERLDPRPHRALPARLHAAVGGREELARRRVPEAAQRRLLELALDVGHRRARALGHADAALERVDGDEVGDAPGVAAQASGDIDRPHAVAAAIDHQEGRAHAGQPDQRHRYQGERHQQHDRAPHEPAGNRQVHVESPSGKNPGQQRGHTPSTSIEGRSASGSSPLNISFSALQKSVSTTSEVFRRHARAPRCHAG